MVLWYWINIFSFPTASIIWFQSDCFTKVFLSLIYFLIIHLVLLCFISLSEGSGFEPGMEYVYEYRGRVNSEGEAGHQSTMSLRAIVTITAATHCDLRLKVRLRLVHQSFCFSLSVSLSLSQKSEGEGSRHMIWLRVIWKESENVQNHVQFCFICLLRGDDNNNDELQRKGICRKSHD